MFPSRFIQFALGMMFMALASLLGASQKETPKDLPKDDLEIFAILQNPSACKGAENLRVEVIVTNRGEVPVGLDISRLSTTIGFLALVDTTEMKFRHEAFSSSYDPVQAPSPSITTLPPNGFFRRDMEIPINSSFFSRAGFYKVNLSSVVRVNQSSQSRDLYGSSTAIFELRACEPS
jgi:hypothetical protein